MINFSCDICGKSGFVNQLGVNIHKRKMHKDVKPFTKKRVYHKRHKVENGGTTTFHFCPRCGFSLKILEIAARALDKLGG